MFTRTEHRRPPTDLVPGLLLAAALILAAPNVASANVGTRMMWLPAMHLLVGNLFIGLIEAIVISAVWRASYFKAALIMIGANYVSTLFGVLFLRALQQVLETKVFPGPPLHQAIPTLTTMGIIAIILSVLLEWPFCRITLPKHRRTWKLGLLASIAAHVVSYAVLVPLYLNASQLTLLTKLRSVPYQDLASKLQPFTVYATERGSTDLVRLDFEPGRVRRIPVQTLEVCGAPDRYAPLIVERLDDGQPHILLASSGEWCEILNLDQSTQIPEALQAERDETGPGWVSRPDDYDHRHSRWGRSWYDLRSTEARTWFPTNYPLIGIGIQIQHADARWGEHFAFETPWDAWRCWSPNALPGDLLVIEVEGQIIAIDVGERTIAFLAYGSWPVVVQHQDSPK